MESVLFVSPESEAVAEAVTEVDERLEVEAERKALEKVVDFETEDNKELVAVVVVVDDAPMAPPSGAVVDAGVGRGANFLTSDLTPETPSFSFRLAARLASRRFAFSTSLRKISSTIWIRFFGGRGVEVNLPLTQRQAV